MEVKLAALYFLSAIIAIVTYFIVVVDMFKKKVSRGFCGLFFFPLTYCHSIKDYSGKNKKLVATLLWTSSLIVLVIRIITIYQANEDLKPFNGDLSAQLSMNCQIRNEVAFEKGIRKYLIVCTPSETDPSSYKDIYDMVHDYRIKYIERILPTYKNTTHLKQDRAVIIGILSPFNIYACFEISSTGNIVNSWNTDQQTHCTTAIQRKRD
jgi:hypothetical protein